MAKGKRLSDPEALCIIEAKLDSGQPLAEADRPTLKCLARLDLIRLIEGHYGETLKTSTKNSVRRLVEHVLGSDPHPERSVASAPSSSPEADGAVEGVVVARGHEFDATALCVHGMSAEGLAALSGAELPGLPELLGLAIAGQRPPLPSVLAVTAETGAPGPAAVAAAAPALPKRESTAENGSWVQPLALLQQVKQEEGLGVVKREEICQHMPMSAEHMHPVQVSSQQQVQRQQKWRTTHAADFSCSHSIWAGSLDHDIHTATAATGFNDSSFNHQLPHLDDHRAEQLGGSYSLQACSSLSSDGLTDISALTDEMMQLQEQHHTQQQQLLHGSMGNHSSAGLCLPHGSLCDPPGFCLDQLLSDSVLHEPSNSSVSSHAIGTAHTPLKVQCAPVHASGAHHGVHAMTPTAPPPTPTAAACRKRCREDWNSSSQPDTRAAYLEAPAHPSTSQSRNDSTSSANICLGSYSVMYGPPGTGGDVGLGGTLAEALEALFGRPDAGTF